MAHLLEPVFDGVGLPDALVYPVAFTIALAVVVGMHVVVGEMVPKNLAIAGPERAALLLAPLLVLVVAGLKPLVVGLNVTANGILRLLRVEPKDEVSSSFTREEVAGFVEASRREGLLDADEYDRVAGALGFIERSVSSVMLPSATLAVVRRGSTVTDVERLCTETGFSRFPVGERGGDGAVLDLVGYLHIKDVLETDPEKRARPIADKWIRPLASVQPADKLHVALTVMRAKGSHLARVVAEDGTALGVVALEDVLEELVGEIREAETAGETSRPGSVAEDRHLLLKRPHEPAGPRQRVDLELADRSGQRCVVEVEPLHRRDEPQVGVEDTYGREVVLVLAGPVAVRLRDQDEPVLVVRGHEVAGAVRDRDALDAATGEVDGQERAVER